MIEIPCLVDHESRTEIMDYAAQKLTNDMICVELGVFMGGTLFRLAQQLRNLGKTTKIYGIDTWEYINLSPESFKWANISSAKEGYDKFQQYLLELNLDIHIIKEDSCQAARHFSDKSVNYLWMDANHGYDGLCQEIRVWMPKMADQCIIAVHDYLEGSIPAAIQDTFGKIERTTSNKCSAILKDTL